MVVVGVVLGLILILILVALYAFLRRRGLAQVQAITQILELCNEIPSCFVVTSKCKRQKERNTIFLFIQYAFRIKDPSALVELLKRSLFF